MPPRKYVPRKRPTAALTNKRIAAVAKRTLLKQTETKKHQVEMIEYVINSLAAVPNHSLCSIGQGTGYAQRVGHKIKCTGFAIQGQVRQNNFTSGNQTLVRMVVIRFKNNNANPPADLLENDANNQPVSPDDLRSIYRRINMDSYEVLKDKTFILGGQNGNLPATKVFKMWIPFNREMRYDSTGTVAPNYNKVHVVAFARDAGNDNVAPNVDFSYCSSMYYKDI